MTEIVHNPWIGRKYQSGIEGQRIAIIGYSHWKGEQDIEEDNENVTKNVLKKVVKGEYSDIHFYRKIQSYFDYDSTNFWNKVLFFNFLPNYVGGAPDRGADGTTAQIEVGRSRFLEIMKKYKPHSVFVFSRKSWESMPPTLEETLGKKGEHIPGGHSNFERHHYFVGGQSIQAFALRHTQGALDAVMYPAVSAAMALSPISPGQLQSLLP